MQAADADCGKFRTGLADSAARDTASDTASDETGAISMRRNGRKDIRKTLHGRLAEIVDTIAFGAKLRIPLAWGQGAFGGAVTGVYSSGRKAWRGAIAGLVMLLAPVAALLMSPDLMRGVGATLLVKAVDWLLATRFAQTPEQE